MTPAMNCPINNCSGPQPAPVFQGAVLAVGHFQVRDVATAVHQVTYISGEGHIARYLKPERLNPNPTNPNYYPNPQS